MFMPINLDSAAAIVYLQYYRRDCGNYRLTADSKQKHIAVGYSVAKLIKIVRMQDDN